MGKLHEILAVDQELQETAKKILVEAIQTFSKKTNLFIGRVKTLTMFDDARQGEADGQREDVPLHTTVWEKLEYVAEHVSKSLDVIAQKEITNTAAVANIVIDGEVIIRELPATLLLGLESRLAKLRGVYNAIPTLDPSVAWVSDDSQKEGAYKNAEQLVANKTEKVVTYAEMSKATKEHKAQIDKVSKDVVVGHYRSTFFCGMITPTQKSRLLGRIDVLIQAVKQARMRANESEAVKAMIGSEIFDFIHAIDRE